jgi:hypothetical protein
MKFLGQPKIPLRKTRCHPVFAISNIRGLFFSEGTELTVFRDMDPLLLRFQALLNGVQKVLEMPTSRLAMSYRMCLGLPANMLEGSQADRRGNRGTHILIYDLWSSRGAMFITEPKIHARALRRNMRDPDGYLIEVRRRDTNSRGGRETSWWWAKCRIRFQLPEKFDASLPRASTRATSKSARMRLGTACRILV